MICEVCDGSGHYWNTLLEQTLYCPNCLTLWVTPMITRVEHWDKGWYICKYDTTENMRSGFVGVVIGPYDTEAGAKRALAETTDDKENTGLTTRKVYDPSRDPTPTAFKVNLDAGIPTDNDDLDAELNGEGEGVQLELQQTQELRDVPPEVQRD